MKEAIYIYYSYYYVLDVYVIIPILHLKIKVLRIFLVIPH